MTGAEIIGTYGEELKGMTERLKEISSTTKASIHVDVSFVRMDGEEWASEDVFVFPPGEDPGEKEEFDHDIFHVL